jgi:lysozyme family protein
MTRFHVCQAITGKWEGGWSDHPDDPGGKTMYGLTDAVWQAYLKRNGKPSRPVRSATKAEVEELFRRQYWDAVRGDDLPPGIDLAVYDFGINSGPSRAIRHLQAALGVRQDGVMGHVTLAAAREAYDRDDDAAVILRIMASREAFVRGLRTWSTFGKGWTNRLRDVAQRAARMEEIEDKALTFSRDHPVRQRTDPQSKPVIYNPTQDATKPLPEPVTPLPSSETIASVGGLAGAAASLLAAVTSPWALGAVVVVIGAIGFWAVKTGRLSLNRVEG